MEKRRVAVVCPLEVFRSFVRMVDQIDQVNTRMVETGGTRYEHVSEVRDVEGRRFEDALFLHRWYSTRLMATMTAEQFRGLLVEGGAAPQSLDETTAKDALRQIDKLSSLTNDGVAVIYFASVVRKYVEAERAKWEREKAEVRHGE